MYEFDEDTAVEEVAPGEFRGRITDRWNIGTVPNGGYMLAVGMAALRRSLPGPDPLTVTGHFLRPAGPGPINVHVEQVKRGRTFCTGMACLVQDEIERVRILATYGSLGNAGGLAHVVAAPPALPPRDSLSDERSREGPEFVHRFEIRSNNMVFTPGGAVTAPEVSGWLRFVDGRQPDVHTLGLIADAFPPPAFHIIEPGWIPTLELTVHVRARPASEWLRCIFRTRFIFGGLLEEDGEVWDETGTLCALSRQLAATPR